MSFDVSSSPAGIARAPVVCVESRGSIVASHFAQVISGREELPLAARTMMQVTLENSKSNALRSVQLSLG